MQVSWTPRASMPSIAAGALEAAPVRLHGRRLRGRHGQDRLPGCWRTPTGAPGQRAAGLCAEAAAVRVRGRRRLRAAGAVGLRQDHAAQHHLGPAAAERGARPVRPARRDAADPGAAQHRPGVPVPGDLRHHDRGREPGVPAAQPRRPRAADQDAHRRGGSDARSGAVDEAAAPRGSRPTRSRRSRSAAAWCARTWRRSCSTSR